MGNGRKVNQTQLSRAVASRSFFLSLPEFVPFLCNHIAFFHIEGHKEIYAQVGQIMSWIFCCLRIQGQRQFITDSPDSLWSLFLALFSRNSKTTSQISFPTLRTRKWGLGRENPSHPYVIFVSLFLITMLGLAQVSSSVPSSFKMVRFLTDSANTIPRNILHLGLSLFPPRTSSYRTK